MTQRDRDRLVALKKARKGLITQRQAAEEIGQSERHVRRLWKRLKGKGDAALVQALRGRRSNRKLDENTKQKALEILRRDVYRGFGPTLAAEYLDSKHDIQAGRETVRTWMIEGKLWRASRQSVDQIHQWRPRRSRAGELVQWDTSEHAWLEERGELRGTLRICLGTSASLCRRRRSDERSGSWTSCGSGRTRPRPKAAWNAVSRRRRTVWSKACV
jgi:transposase